MVAGAALHLRVSGPTVRRRVGPGLGRHVGREQQPNTDGVSAVDGLRPD